MAKSTERLLAALREVGAPRQMIRRAERGYYHDYESPIATPIVQLVQDARAAGLEQISSRAMKGDFDATKEESDEWYEREGRAIVERELPPDMRQLFEPRPRSS